MTKIGKMIYEDGIEKGERNGRREERIVAVFNMLKLSVPESQILELYSAEDLKAAKQRQYAHVIERMQYLGDYYLKLGYYSLTQKWLSKVILMCSAT